MLRYLSRMNALTHFPPNRTEALTRLQGFLPKAGKDYAARRNFDLGSGRHVHVSTLSPYIRTRMLTEEEVLQSVLSRFSLSTAEKFVQEVYWRTYWKGWLEMRPSVWAQYQADLRHAHNNLQTQAGLRQKWQAACNGETGIECFDHWAHELVDTGYLHNHARMWFASIWIFTLGLPWTLGADFFLRHLLDGDPASNTLSWRWVAGLQTKGKTYLARTSNISKFTEGRFHPKWQLATDAIALDGPPHPERAPLPEQGIADPAKRTGLLLHSDDLSPGFVTATLAADRPVAILRTEQGFSPLHIAPHLTAFLDDAFDDMVTRYGFSNVTRLGSVDDIRAWAATAELEQIVAPYAPVGPNQTALSHAAQQLDIPLVQIRRTYDSAAWPHATHGFFKFKDKIPKLVQALTQKSAA